MATRDKATQPGATICAPERRRKIYRAAAQRLQRFADAHPEVRFDADTLAITFATDSLNEALASYMDGACGPEVVCQAFDCYERALIEASELHALLQTIVTALRESSELIERYVWSAAPGEAAEAQENNHRAICALKAARDKLCPSEFLTIVFPPALKTDVHVRRL
jgi:hypothetical protein